MSAIRAIHVPQAQLAPKDRVGLDLTVLVPTLLLVGLGVAMVFSASMPAVAGEGGDVFRYLKKQLLFAALGLAVMYAMTRVSMDSVCRRAGLLLGTTIFLLVLVLIVGVRLNGAKSWLPVPGTGFRFQPSELAKLALIIAAARYFAKFPRGLPNGRRAVPPLLVLGVTAGLIAVQPDMGTAAVIVLALFVYYHIAGAKLRHLLAAGGFGLAFAGLMVALHPYQLERIRSFLSRGSAPLEADYHATQSLIAMGSGGLTGRGFCGSIEKYFYLPAAINDSILAVIGEELGFVFVLPVVLLFAWLAWRGIHIAARAPDRFSGLVAAGVTVMLAAQALTNIAVVTDSIPATGVPLPFVSYGGSSLIFSLAGIGLLLNVARRQAPSQPKQEAA